MTSTLVAIEWDDLANRDDLFRRLEHVIVDVQEDTASNGKPVLRITFDDSFDGMRDTVAHGHGCATGFVCHIEKG